MYKHLNIGKNSLWVVRCHKCQAPGIIISRTKCNLWYTFAGIVPPNRKVCFPCRSSLPGGELKNKVLLFFNRHQFSTVINFSHGVISSGLAGQLYVGDHDLIVSRDDPPHVEHVAGPDVAGGCCSVEDVNLSKINAVSEFQMSKTCLLLVKLLLQVLCIQIRTVMRMTSINMGRCRLAMSCTLSIVVENMDDEEGAHWAPP